MISLADDFHRRQTHKTEIRSLRNCGRGKRQMTKTQSWMWQGNRDQVVLATPWLFYWFKTVESWDKLEEKLCLFLTLWRESVIKWKSSPLYYRKVSVIRRVDGRRFSLWVKTSSSLFTASHNSHYIHINLSRSWSCRISIFHLPRKSGKDHKSGDLGTSNLVTFYVKAIKY